MDRNPPLARQDLYPPIEPYASGMLRLNAVHTMYWEQSGNPDGKPIVFLHGGPGAGSTATHRRFFDPQYYRIVVICACCLQQSLRRVADDRGQFLYGFAEQPFRLGRLESD